MNAVCQYCSQQIYSSGHSCAGMFNQQQNYQQYNNQSRRSQMEIAYGLQPNYAGMTIEEIGRELIKIVEEHFTKERIMKIIGSEEKNNG